jgi:Anti-sigma-K factor rskA
VTSIATLEHVAGCPQCRAELSRLVELSQQEPDPALGQMPLDAVWRVIRDELSLVALPGRSGEGTAELIRERETTELRVRVEGAPPQQEFREVWLINADGKRMYSLGVLSAAGTGTYPLPARWAAPWRALTSSTSQSRRTTATSLHSQNSQVRGTLPG